jgi:hypothetical protein
MNPELEIAADGVNQVVLQSELATLSDPTKEGVEEKSICANCGAVLLGKYCHACGQSSHIHRSLLHLLEELGHGLLHFDTKAWRTFPALILRPGKLTRDYIAGQRTRFVSPLALFLFMMFFMFFVFSFNSNTSFSNGYWSNEQGMEEQKQELQSTLLEQEQIKLNLISQNLSVKDQDEIILKTQRALNKIELKLSRKQEASASKTSASDDEGSWTQIGKDVTREDIEKNLQINLPFISKDQMVDKIYHANQNPELSFYKIKSGIAKFAFLLVPLTLPFLWLMFAWRRKFTMFDHAVFSLYSLSFMALFFSAMSVLLNFGSKGLGVFLIFIVPPIHIFQQLRHAYQLSFFSSFWRTMALLFVAMTAIVFYAIIVLGISM